MAVSGGSNAPCISPLGWLTKLEVKNYEWWHIFLKVVVVDPGQMQKSCCIWNSQAWAVFACSQVLTNLKNFWGWWGTTWSLINWKWVTFTSFNLPVLAYGYSRLQNRSCFVLAFRSFGQCYFPHLASFYYMLVLMMRSYLDNWPLVELLPTEGIHVNGTPLLKKFGNPLS